MARRSSITGVVFDKDGTLVDFNHLWGGLIDQWLDLLTTGFLRVHDRADGAKTIKEALAATLGYDLARQEVIAESPFAVASTARLLGAAATVLYQQGLPWYLAEQITDTAWQELNPQINPHAVRPVGRVFETFKQLHGRGVKLAVFTNDDRSSTGHLLGLLRIKDFVSTVVCGDDPLPNKPDPAGLYQIAMDWGLETGRLMMVGDTASDMICGRRAGVGSCVGVRGGAGDEKRLAAAADHLIDKIEEIIPLILSL